MMPVVTDAEIVRQFVSFYTARGWSRRQAAREINLPYSTLKMYEWNERHPPRQVLGEMLLLIWRYADTV